jgi:hypothetical protein
MPVKKIVIKVKRPKRRVPIAPPSKRHKSKRDYRRVKKVSYDRDHES